MEPADKIIDSLTEPDDVTYRVTPDDGQWAALRTDLTSEGRMDVENPYPLGRYETPEAAWRTCSEDAQRRRRNREVDIINAIEAARAKVPVDDQPAPEREN